MTTRAVPPAALTGLGLPPSVVACLFDLDGVLTSTASTHAAAWAVALDEVLRRYAHREGLAFVPFDPVADYRTLVDGRPRDEGTRTFLAARGVVLAEGGSSDGPGADTVAGVGARKSQVMARLLRRDGVHAFPGSVRYLRAARSAGLRCGVVSSSTSARAVLVAAGLIELFAVLADGASTGHQHLRGKPAPDSVLAAARALGVPAGSAAVFEDAVAGVEAGCAGGFGYVVGVDRGGARAALHEAGADVVVADLADLLRPVSRGSG